MIPVRNHSLRRHPARQAAAAVVVLGAVLSSAFPAAADFNAGLQAYRAGDHASAAEEWRAAAAAGDPAAQRNLGLLYLRGEGVPRDPAVAALWFERAVTQGFTRAAANLADLHLHGNGVPRDPTRAAQLFRMAAEGGVPEAQYNLALLLDNGYGVDRDPAQALEWLARAEAAGYAPARAELAKRHGQETPGPDTAGAAAPTDSGPTISGQTDTAATADNTSPDSQDDSGGIRVSAIGPEAPDQAAEVGNSLFDRLNAIFSKASDTPYVVGTR